MKNETIAENVIEIVIFIPIIALVTSVIVWVISLFMYGFGELVESNKLLVEKLKKQSRGFRGKETDPPLPLQGLLQKETALAQELNYII